MSSSGPLSSCAVDRSAVSVLAANAHSIICVSVARRHHAATKPPKNASAAPITLLMRARTLGMTRRTGLVCGLSRWKVTVPSVARTMTVLSAVTEREAKPRKLRSHIAESRH